MKILIIHHNDDNFGDNLISVCFMRILQVVLKNLGYDVKDFSIEFMAVKHPDTEIIKSSDLIFFAGGGIFGFSYLGFFDGIKTILNTATENNIPVVISSIGANNSDISEENELKLKKLLSAPCIKSISVREFPEEFKKYTDKTVEQVCDPVVWSKYIYTKSIKNATNNTIGINVVRGGLFKDNGLDWSLNQEGEFLKNLRDKLVENGYACRFYTNGSTLDNNTMLYYSENFGIPENELIFVDSSRELIETISGFNCIISTRMHSSIVAYAVGVSAINLVWNKKITAFFEATEQGKNAISLENRTVENLLNFVEKSKHNNRKEPNTKYLMTLYNKLFYSLKDILAPEKQCDVYTFEQIKESLSENAVSADFDFSDMKLKISHGEKRYFSMFKKSRSTASELKQIKSQTAKQIADKDKKIKALEDKIKNQNDTISSQKAEINKHIKKEAGQAETIKKQKAELDRINSKFIVRAYRKIKRIFRR